MGIGIQNIINEKCCSVMQKKMNLKCDKKNHRYTMRNCNKLKTLRPNPLFENKRLDCYEILYLGYLWLNQVVLNLQK